MKLSTFATTVVFSLLFSSTSFMLGMERGKGRRRTQSVNFGVSGQQIQLRQRSDSCRSLSLPTASVSKKKEPTKRATSEPVDKLKIAQFAVALNSKLEQLQTKQETDESYTVPAAPLHTHRETADDFTEYRN